MSVYDTEDFYEEILHSRIVYLEEKAQSNHDGAWVAGILFGALAMLIGCVAVYLTL